MYRYKKIGFVKILDIWFDTGRYLSEEYNIKILHSNDKLHQEYYDFKLNTKTFLLDISKDKKDIMAGFDNKSCRYCINKAMRDEVRVWKAFEREDRTKYLLFQEEFCLRKEIPNVTEEDVQNLDIYCAESKEGEFLGGCAFLLSEDKQTVRYKYGATMHKLNANEAILWRAMCDYHDEGYRIFDLGGCVSTEDKDSYYYRHYHFKKKFGGELVDSYSYFSIKGIYRVFYYMFLGILKIFFGGDVNGLVQWLNKRGLIQ